MKRKYSLMLLVPFTASVIYFVGSIEPPQTRTPADEIWQFYSFFFVMVFAASNLGNFLCIAMHMKNTKQTEPEVYDRIMKNFGYIIWDELK